MMKSKMNMSVINRTPSNQLPQDWIATKDQPLDNILGDHPLFVPKE